MFNFKFVTMNRIVFGSFIHDEDLEAKREIGPFVTKVKVNDIKREFNDGKAFKEFRGEGLVYLMNTKITPLLGTEDVLITGDRVEFSKVPF